MNDIADKVQVAPTAFIHGAMSCPGQRRQGDGPAQCDQPEARRGGPSIEERGDDRHRQRGYSNHPGQPDVSVHQQHLQDVVMQLHDAGHTAHRLGHEQHGRDR
ncbi:hypothetical protein D3C85_1385560 [compost metagenome]